MFRNTIFPNIQKCENILHSNVKFFNSITNEKKILQKKSINIKYPFKTNVHPRQYILFYSSASNAGNDLLHNDLTEILSNESSTIMELSSSISESSISINEPLLSSLGLGGFTPSGFVQNSLEFLHLNFELPWWQAIVTGTIVIRFALFPLVIKAQKNAANMQIHLPTIQRMQEDMIEARKSGELEEAIKKGHKLSAYMKINKINPLKNFLVPMAQIPIFISVFTGIREMANLPVESWKSGGALWFTDLTISDPYYLLPLLTVATLAATIELGADGMRAANMDKVIRTILRSLPIITFPIICSFPSAMLCYWFTANTFSMIQVAFLKIPNVKKMFDIPELINHDNAYQSKRNINRPRLNFFDALRENAKNIELAHKMSEREKMKVLKLKEPIDVKDIHSKSKL